MAAELNRPLITIRGDFLYKEPPWTAEMIESWFKLSARWGAVLLVTDADAYIDRSDIPEIQRRCLGARLIHTLQYYRGVLFLATRHTDRVDEKLLSYVDAPIYYRDMNDDERWSLWQALFAELKQEKADGVAIHESALKHVQHDHALLSLKMNAHEIRQGKNTPFSSIH
jgi:hypothetical protein